MHGFLVLVFALLQRTTAEQTSGDGSSQALGHIVVLKEGLNDGHLNKHLDWVKSIHKRSLDTSNDNENQENGVKHTYHGGAYGFHGYAGSFSRDVLKSIKEHKHVDFVEEDQVIILEPTRRDENTDGDMLPEGGTRKKNKGHGLLSKGQGYNSFLEKGMILDAVILHEGEKRRDIPARSAEELVSQTTMKFNFTEPSADFAGVDVESYFYPPDLDAIMEDILADLENDEQDVSASKVLFTRAADRPDCTGALKFSSDLAEDYNSYLKALDISVAATVSGWGQSASVSGSYLNQAEFSSNALTYVAKIDMRRQLDSPAGFQFNMNKYTTTTFARNFGDRWIRGFHTGGKMIARLTFRSKGTVSKVDLKAHIEASLKFWGVTADISASVKKSQEEVSKHADVEISLFYQGDLGRVMGQSGSPDKITATSADGAFHQVKSWADQFMDNACRHDYEYQPLLEEYRNAEGFPEHQKILDYRTAHRVSSMVLKQLVRISEMKQYLLNLTTIDDEIKMNVEFDEIDMVKQCQDWVDSVAENPENSRSTGRDLIKTLRDNFFKKYAPYISNSFTNESPRADSYANGNRYISGVKVERGATRPANSLGNINYGFTGGSIWLVPTYTSNPKKACTTITVEQTRIDYADAVKFLSKDGKYMARYFRCVTSSERKIRRLALSRGSGIINYDKAHGFVDATSNINEGFDMSPLYLMWSFDETDPAPEDDFPEPQN
ncbi:Proteinase inhibitor I9, subtilisin propeptide [Metarhizium brunneum]